MSEEKKQDFEFEELLKYRDSVTQTMNYSVQRIDILIIALCTSGIVFVTNTIGNNNTNNYTELKIAALFFVLSILINLTSQFIAYYQNRKLLSIYDQKVVDYKNDPESFNDDIYKRESDSAHSKTAIIHTLNIISFVFLTIGMISCLLYYYC